MKEADKVYCIICKPLGINRFATFKIITSFVNKKAKKGEVEQVFNETNLCEEHIYCEPFISMNNLKPMIKDKMNIDIFVPENGEEFQRRQNHMLQKIDDMRGKIYKKMFSR